MNGDINTILFTGNVQKPKWLPSFNDPGPFSVYGDFRILENFRLTFCQLLDLRAVPEPEPDPNTSSCTYRIKKSMNGDINTILFTGNVQKPKWLPSFNDPGPFSVYGDFRTRHACSRVFIFYGLYIILAQCTRTTSILNVSSELNPHTQ